MKEGEELEIANREAYEKIFFSEDAKHIFPMAHYMIQLEKTKDLSICFLDEIKNAEYPFIYTEYARPELAIGSGEMLVDAITAECIAAERQFREALLKVIRDTHGLQEKLFGYEFDEDPASICAIVRNIKDYFCKYPALGDTDEDILEKIIYTICFDRWFHDFLETNSDLEEDKEEPELVIEDED